MSCRDERKISVVKIIIISASVALAFFAAAAILYRLFKKYFRITFDCGDCDDCCEDCFGNDFECDCSDEDFIPECNIADDDISEDDAE